MSKLDFSKYVVIKNHQKVRSFLANQYPHLENKIYRLKLKQLLNIFRKYVIQHRKEKFDDLIKLHPDYPLFSKYFSIYYEKNTHPEKYKSETNKLSDLLLTATAEQREAIENLKKNLDELKFAYSTSGVSRVSSDRVASADGSSEDKTDKRLLWGTVIVVGLVVAAMVGHSINKK